MIAALAVLGLLCLAVVWFPALHGGRSWRRLSGWLQGHPWKDKRVVPVNILDELNNDGIAWTQDPRDGNFDHPDYAAHEPGSSLPGDELPAAGAISQIQEAEDLKFLFPSSRDGAFNNIACRGQQVGVSYARYRELALVAASHAGAVEAEVRLMYSDRLETRRVRFPGWLEPPGAEPVPGLTTASHFHRASQSTAVERRESNARLWLCRVPLDEQGELRGVMLPYDERIHVFAVSLIPVPGQDYLRRYSDYVLRAYRRAAKRRPPHRWEIARGTHAVREGLNRARPAIEEAWPREFAWLEMSVEHLEYRLRAFLSGSQFSGEDELGKAIAEVSDALAAFARKENLYEAKRGNFLAAYRSRLDGTLQPYSLSVPEDYDPSRKYPLIILLHGHGWYQPFQGHPTLTGPGVFYVGPHGRGSMDYMFVAEEDLLEVIRDVTGAYSIDEDRIALAGSSMGGTGCWNYGVKFPHLFAAVAPTCGNSNHRVWEERWGWGSTSPPGPLESLPEPFDRVCSLIADALDPYTYAGNMLNLPSFCLHGAMDEVVPVEHSRTMVARLGELGCPVTYREDPEAGHGGFTQALCDEQWNWLFRQTRVRTPTRIRHRASKLKYGRAYWLTIRQFTEPLSFAEIEADARDEELIIRTRNVRAIAIDWNASPFAGKRAGDVRLRIDGVTVENWMGTELCVGPEGKWRQGEPEGGPRKRPGLEGPVHEVYTTPFMLVYGTPENDPYAAQVLEAEARRFVRDWETLYTKPCRVKPDSEVSASDIADYSLVLYGNAEQNTVYQGIAEDLPIRVDGQEVRVGERTWRGADLGVKFCYPNPRNPERYVCVFGGTTWRGTYGINNRFGNWFHWGPFDNYGWFDYAVFDERTNSPATMVAVGFFDQNWRLAQRYLFEGNSALREQSLAVVGPRHFRVPAPGRLYLSDLRPLRVEQHKGNVNSDRSFRGNPLRLGGRTFEKGLGARATSRVEYAIEGRYERFQATVGIDLEGGEGTELRLRNEFIQFQVWGDGHLLYWSPWLQWDHEPVEVRVSIKGVERLDLRVEGSSARWHFGSADWADAYIE